MIHISLCRDPYSYEPLQIEHALYEDTATGAQRNWERTMRDYLAYVTQREGSVSMVKMELYRKNAETNNWDYQQQWEHKLTLKKMVVINPELEAARKNKPVKARKSVFEVVEEMQAWPAPVDVFQEVQQ